MKNLWLIWKLFRGATKKVKAADKKLVAWLSPAWWARFRKGIEEASYEMWQKRDEGGLAFFQCDDAFFFGVLVAIKSDHLYAIWIAQLGKPGTSVEEAVRALYGKDPDSSRDKLKVNYVPH